MRCDQTMAVGAGSLHKRQAGWRSLTGKPVSARNAADPLQRRAVETWSRRCVYLPRQSAQSDADGTLRTEANWTEAQDT